MKSLSGKETCRKPQKRIDVSRTLNMDMPSMICLNDHIGFLKWGYHQIIHFNEIFHYKQSILGYPNDYGNP